jgi:hypothetical protein
MIAFMVKLKLRLVYAKGRLLPWSTMIPSEIEWHWRRAKLPLTCMIDFACADFQKLCV